MTDEEMIEEQNAYYMAGYPSRRSENKTDKDEREKQIEIDAEQIRALQKQNGELTDKVKELEAQIEKMKSDVIECFGSEYNVLVAKLLDKWEIKEK